MNNVGYLSSYLTPLLYYLPYPMLPPGNPVGLVSGVGRDVAALLRPRRHRTTAAAADASGAAAPGDALSLSAAASSSGSAAGSAAGAVATNAAVLVRNTATGVLDIEVKVLASISKGEQVA